VRERERERRGRNKGKRTKAKKQNVRTGRGFLRKNEETKKSRGENGQVPIWDGRSDIPRISGPVAYIGDRECPPVVAQLGVVDVVLVVVVVVVVVVVIVVVVAAPLRAHINYRPCEIHTRTQIGRVMGKRGAREGLRVAREGQGGEFIANGIDKCIAGTRDTRQRRLRLGGPLHNSADRPISDCQGTSWVLAAIDTSAPLSPPPTAAADSHPMIHVASSSPLPREDTFRRAPVADRKSSVWVAKRSPWTPDDLSINQCMLV
jgi:hypothetical protein